MAMSVVYSNFCGMVVSEIRSGVERDYMPDTLGSTAALLDSTQTMTDTWQYCPYGEVAARSGTSETDLRFVGMLGYVKDALDKLFYVRARHLRPDLARWITVDPKGADHSALRRVSGFVWRIGMLVALGTVSLSTWALSNLHFLSFEFPSLAQWKVSIDGRTPDGPRQLTSSHLYFVRNAVHQVIISRDEHSRAFEFALPKTNGSEVWYVASDGSMLVDGRGRRIIGTPLD
jgi:RHS repeat-associated protein